MKSRPEAARRRVAEARARQSVLVRGLLDTPGRRCVLRNVQTGAVLAHSLELAETASTRRTGLLGRAGLARGGALILAPCFGIHTWFMRFPIDVLFVARDGRVVRACRDVSPWRVRVALTAHTVIELPSGVIERTGTRRGDLLVVAGG